MYRSSSSSESFMPIALAVGLGSSILLFGTGINGLLYNQDMRNLYRDQSEELKSNPLVFAITDPDEQPAGEVVASWQKPGYDEDHNYILRFDALGNASLSDTYTPTGVVGRPSAHVADCRDLNLDVYDEHVFYNNSQAYKVLLTRVGNAAVCQEI